jgi:hypothetical protein
MANSHVPVRVPERPSEPVENSSTRPAGWRQEKKPSRFVIKIGGIVPT